MRSAVELLVVGVCVALCACGDSKPNTPFGPTNGGDGVTVVGDDTPRPGKPDEDGGPLVVDAGVDGATDADSGVAAFNCERVQALASTGGDTPNLTSTDQPDDFIVVRQAVSWSTDCLKPVLTISLSDGTCPRGAGHELQIALSVNDVEDGAIHLGENDLRPEAESSSIRVRYTRPKRLRPNGTWGTCDAVTGQVTFLEAPQIVIGGLLQARYQFMLTPCDGSTNAPIGVFGAFKLTLRHDLTDVCPNRTH